MANRKVFLSLRARRSEDLCPICWLPSVDVYTVSSLHDTGVSVRERSHCKTCGLVPNG